MIFLRSTAKIIKLVSKATEGEEDATREKRKRDDTT
jgi:hypothetical protein